MFISKKHLIILSIILIFLLGIGIGFGLGKIQYSKNINLDGISQTGESETKSDGKNKDFVGEFKVSGRI